MPVTQYTSREPGAYGMVRTPVSRDEYEDRYAAKLVKYIPAEVLAVFIPLVALANAIGSELWIWLTIALGVVSVIGYGRWQATDVLRNQIEAAHGAGTKDERSAWWREREYDRVRPYPYYYGLTVVAFVAWALATAKPVRDAMGLQPELTEYIVATVAFLLPLADVTLKHFSKWLGTVRPSPTARAASR